MSAPNALAQVSAGLDRAAIVDVSRHHTPDGRVVVGLSSGHLLELTRQSVRAPNFRLLVQGPDGALREIPAGAVETYRGTVVGDAGSSVAASLADGRLLARLHGMGEDLWVQPAIASGHLLYRSADVSVHGRTCGADLVPPGVHPTISSAPTEGTTAGVMVAELAIDTDYEYFRRYGSTTAVQNQVEALINAINVQYERDVGIQYQITTLIVRSSSSQPYTSTDPNTLLDQMRSEWNRNQGAVARDTAHLLTGKDLDGSTIGLAWIGVVCWTSYGYGIAASDFNGNFASATDLSAHELGHNWNAWHCTCSTYTMHAYQTNANVFNPVGTIPTIESFRNSLSCLTAGSGGGGGGGGGSVATYLMVDNISLTKPRVGREKGGEAIVTVLDDLGAPVQGAVVTGSFSGTFAETIAATTDRRGRAVLTTSSTTRGKLQLGFCVDDVTGALPYRSSSNTVTCR